MAYQTDSDGNYFVGNTLDDTGFTFVSDLPDCLTAALGAGNYAVKTPIASAANNVADMADVRLEWRPSGVGETLSGAITLNNIVQNYYSETNTNMSGFVLNANARFGIKPFDGGGSYATQTPMRNAAGQYLNIYPGTISVTALSLGGRARLFATITQQEVIFYLGTQDYSQFFIGYQGVLQNISSQFSGAFPKGSVGFSCANVYGTPDIGGISIWTDNTVRRLTFATHSLSCTTASGLTLGSNLWMTDLPFRFNASSNNNPIIGTPKNLKLAIGTSVALGTLYQPSTPIDGGSNLWLCVGRHPGFTNGRIMMRVKT